MTTNSLSNMGIGAASVRRAAALLTLAAVVAIAQPAGQAQGGDALRFSKSYTITGNYTIGTVDLPASGINDSVTGTIPMSGVPANADILAAFLYWETISTDTAPFYDNAKFRGSPITVVKKTSQELSGALEGCWVTPTGGQTATLTMYRA